MPGSHAVPLTVLADGFVGLHVVLGAAYVLSDPARFTSPAYDAAEMVLPVPAWGALFIAVAVLTFAARWAHTPRPMQVALIGGGLLWVLWAGFFAVSALRSPVAPFAGSLVYGVLGAVMLAVGFALAPRPLGGRR